MDSAENGISELEERPLENTQTEVQRENEWETKQKMSNIHIPVVPEKREQGRSNIQKHDQEFSTTGGHQLEI